MSQVVTAQRTAFSNRFSLVCRETLPENGEKKPRKQRKRKRTDSTPE
jgi:hypothetical protein